MTSNYLKNALGPVLTLTIGTLAIGLYFSLQLFSLELWGIPIQLLPLFAVIVGSGIPLLWQIIKKLLQRDVGTDILAALAIVTAFFLSEYLACVLVIMMLAAGEALEVFAVKKASSALNALLGRMPLKAQRKTAQEIENIFVSDIRIDDIILVAPHETCPVDGVVIKGQGYMDESYLSGEPYGVKKAPGARVLSGSINGENLLWIKARTLAKDSRYAQIVQVMRDAEMRRPQMRRLADRLGAFFAPISLFIAIGAWIYSGESLRFLAVLVVATPCPLLIAIPVAIISTISMAARRGIIIRDPSVLENLPKCRTAIFDKTGTLTYGKPELTSFITAAQFQKEDVLLKAASLERYSKHPLAVAILNAAQKFHLFLKEAGHVSEIPGKGLVGNVDGEEIIITHRKAFKNDFSDQESLLPPSALGLECIILIDKKYAATLQFRDTPRAFGKNFIEHLAPFHAFTRVMLLSGDRDSEVQYLAKELGIENAYASLSPEQKLEIVKKEAAKAKTLFMGDGINDAPALAMATVGLAFGQQTSVSSEASGAVILESSLKKLDELLHMSMRMRRIALESALGGMALSFIAMGFAFLGHLSPVYGALLQQGIDALAIINALRLAVGKKVEIDLPH
ncbi:MAG: heavy metal translocating P-type ATPase [Myxococcales bacterium]|nr:heavy metal translocating P-type ATPase [Myxococcales bacterium]